MQFTQILGFIGSGLVIVAYVPQISHLINKACSQGISMRAYALWLASSALLLTHAIAIGSTVFILLQSLHLVATATIFAYSYKSLGKACEGCFKKISNGHS